MKRFFLCFISTLLTLGSISTPLSVSAHTEDVVTDIPPNILFLGDSIATGFGLDGYSDGKEKCRSYANQLAEKYSFELDGKCKTSMHNEAIDGQTSGELLEKLLSGTFDQQLRNADAVVVSIGGNDLLTVLWDFIKDDLKIDSKNLKNNISEIIDSITSLGTEIDERLSTFEANLTQIAVQINAKSDGVLVIQTLYNPFEDFEQAQVKNFVREKILALNSSIESHKNDDAKYIVADVYSKLTGSAEKMTRIKQMDIHPNQAGHDAISECVDKTIRTERYYYHYDVMANPAQSNRVQKDDRNEYIFILFSGIAAAFLIVVAFLRFRTRK